ncbi:MAG TPA: S1/P1 nuclease, partial [Vicinamibacteria bacterium]|nr:S1/P1 nuclease [Vicinamibacteria bacterium]
MTSRTTLLFVLCMIAGLASPSATHAWGCKAHQTIALLAEKHLTANAKQAAFALLDGNPIDPQLKRFCGHAGLDAFADAATWADDYRSMNSATAPWHFIDIPLGATRDQVHASCGAGGCVTQAIQDQLAVLKDATAGAKRADALRFIIHFVGDLHQPLHATTNSDRGGNCVPVKFFRRSPHLTGTSYTPNLHHVWDTEIPERQMEGADPAEYAATLEANYADSFPRWQQGGINLEDWAWDSHQHAVETTYGSLPKKIAVEPDVPV